MGDPTHKVATSDAYPLDLSDLSPRVSAGMAREGVTPESVHEFRRTMTADEAEQMQAYERSLAGMGMTLDDVCDAQPLSAEERAEMLRDAATWATPEQFEQFKRALDRA